MQFISISCKQEDYRAFEGLDEGRAAHRLRLDDVVVEERLDVVERAEREVTCAGSRAHQAAVCVT